MPLVSNEVGSTQEVRHMYLDRLRCIHPFISPSMNGRVLASLQRFLCTYVLSTKLCYYAMCSRRFFVGSLGELCARLRLACFCLEKHKCFVPCARRPLATAWKKMGTGNKWEPTATRTTANKMLYISSVGK